MLEYLANVRRPREVRVHSSGLLPTETSGGGITGISWRDDSLRSVGLLPPGMYSYYTMSQQVNVVNMKM